MRHPGRAGETGIEVSRHRVKANSTHRHWAQQQCAASIEHPRRTLGLLFQQVPVRVSLIPPVGSHRSPKLEPQASLANTLATVGEPQNGLAYRHIT